MHPLCYHLQLTEIELGNVTRALPGVPSPEPATEVQWTEGSEVYLLKSQFVGGARSPLKGFHLFLLVVYVPQNIPKIIFFWTGILTAPILHLHVCVLEAKDVLSTKNQYQRASEIRRPRSWGQLRRIRADLGL